ncbi:MAG: MbcA/ParS/Xre antitoxin family protein [Bryobacteraceae bacterium]
MPEKPSETASSEQKDLLWIFLAIADQLFAVNADAIKSLGHIDTRNLEFFHRDYNNADFKALLANMVRSEKGTAVGKPSLALRDPVAEKLSAKVFSPMRMNVADAPVGGIGSSVEQPVIDEMIARATEVIGSRDEAMRWLGTPVRALNFATPISILGTKGGVEHVNDVLCQMEYGIW